MRGLRFRAAARPILAATLCASLGACGTVMGSIPFRSTGDAEMVLKLAPGDVVAVGSTTCDPLRPAHLCTHRSIGFEGYDYACRMSCGVRLERGGETVVRVRFRAWAGPPGNQLREADLIVKQ